MDSKDFAYGGKYWNIVLEVITIFFANLIDQIEYILPNCTVLVYVMARVKGLPLPANSMPNANLLHTVVANGWEAIKYQDGMALKENDIVEWSCNHVAFMIDSNNLYASWWTNYNGTSKGKRRDTKLTTTLKDTVEYLYARYIYRYFHQTTFEDECKRGGGNAKPSYIIRYKQTYPTIKSDGRNESKDQVYVSTSTQNIRSYPDGNIVGVSEIGYYDVGYQEKVETGGYTWYAIGNKEWIAGVKDRVEFLPMKEEPIKPDIDYKAKLEKAKELAKEIIGL